MEKIFSEILSMSIDSAWLIAAVIIVRAAMKKSPMYFRKILWGLVGLRLVVPFSLQSALSLVPKVVPQTTQRVTGQISDVAAVERSISFEDIAPYVWVAVGVGFLIYGIISYIKLRMRIIDSTLVNKNIYQSEKIQSPFVCGFLKPKIYVPCGLDEETRSCVLKHEETHIKYLDHIIKAIGFVVLCIHWFNPLVWASYFMLCKDIELSCDESVIKKYDDAQCKAYAKALLDLGVDKVRLSACPIAFGEVSIKTRIKSVISYKKAGRALIFASLCVCIMVAVCFMTEPAMALNENTEATEVAEVIEEPETEAQREASDKTAKPEAKPQKEASDKTELPAVAPQRAESDKAEKPEAKPSTNATTESDEKEELIIVKPDDEEYEEDTEEDFFVIKSEPLYIYSQYGYNNKPQKTDPMREKAEEAGVFADKTEKNDLIVVLEDNIQ